MGFSRIAIIGDGGWGTTMAVALAKKGHSVTIWSAFSEHAREIDRIRENKRFLPGIKIPDAIKIKDDPRDLSRSDFHVLMVPCQYLRDTLKQFSGIIKGPVISGIKGIENSSLKRPSEMIREVFPDIPLTVLSGPTIAYEVARGVPTAAVVGSKDDKLARNIQEVFSTDRFRLYLSEDIVGVEMGGALKNIIAIAAGISDGMGFGANTKAALLTRGLVEIARLGVAMGARKETFNGLSGVGDLATTCMSSHSRNRWFGEEIGKGKLLQDVLGKTEMVVEGVATAKSAYNLAQKYKVDMPITAEIYKVLYEHKDPKIAVRELMTRTPKKE